MRDELLSYDELRRSPDSKLRAAMFQVFIEATLGNINNTGFTIKKKFKTTNMDSMYSHDTITSDTDQTEKEFDIHLRKGIIRLSPENIVPNELQFKASKMLFGSFIPVHIDHRPFKQDTVYHGYSEYFDKVKEGEVTPEYVVIFTTDTEQPKMLHMRIQRQEDLLKG